MATVTGLTAARMLAIEAASIVDGAVVGDDLILTKHDSTTINAGVVKGPQGPPGDPGPPGDGIEDLKSLYAAVRLDRNDVDSRAFSGGQAIADYNDSIEVVEAWVDETGVNAAANGQVSGGRWYADNAAVPGGWTKDVSEYALDSVDHWRLSTLLYHKAGGAASAYFGLNSAAPDAALVANDPDTFSIGINASNQRAWLMGANIAAIATYNTGATLGANPTADTTFSFVIEADPVWITFTIKAIGSIASFRTTRVKRSELLAGSKSINNLSCYLADARGLSGTAFGPWVLQVGSMQRARSKTISNQVVDGVDFTVRWMDRAGVLLNPGAGVFFYGLPASYDARVPAPVVLWCHQSVTGAAWDPWEETRVQPVTQALLSAGYIVAGCNNPAIGDGYGNDASLDTYAELYAFLKETYNLGPLFLYGASMGGLDAANIIGRREFPTPAAAAIVGGAYDLGYIWDLGGTYQTAVEAAYSATDRADLLIKSVDYDPIRRDGALYRGVPWRFYTSAGDTLQPLAGQNAFAAIVEPYAPESEVVIASGAHLDPSQYQANDLLAFYDRYR